MPDAIITSTASTFGTISGTFAADQSTIVGTVSGVITGTLSGSVGVPGPQGPTGPQGPIGPEGPPGEGGTWGSIVGTLSDQTDLQNALDAKQNVSGMSAYLTKAGNLSGLTDLFTARDNLNLGTLSNPTFAGLTAQGSGSNVANLTPTSLTLDQTGYGYFTIQPSQGIRFPDASVQTTAFPAGADVPTGGTTGQALVKVSNSNYDVDWATISASATWGSITGTLSSQTDLQTALDLKAPLASPAFTGNPTAPTAALGDNDTSLATTAFVQQELLSGTANARNLEVYVRNQTGSTIPAGSIVYINGATGNRPTITLAQANNDANSAQTFGFVKTSIANNGFGFVIVRGELENIDTSALTEGVQLYLSPTTAGTWTTTKPSAPQHLVYVGICVRAHPTQGVILVAVQNGYELEELHDVSIGTLANNDLLAYESSTDLWKNKTYSALGLLTSATAASTYAPIASPTFTGLATFDNPGNYAISVPGSGTGFDVRIEGQLISMRTSGTEVIRIANNGIKYPDGVTQTVAFPGFTGYAPLASPALTGNVTIASNSSGAALFIEQAGTGNILTLHDQAADTTFVAIDQNGKVNTIPSVAASAGFNIAHGTAPTTPVNGDLWTTTSGLFARINGANRQYVDFDGTQTINGSKTFSNANNTFGNSTAAGTTNIASGATISGATKAVNLGTSGVAGSTTNITIGSTTGTSTTTLQGTTNGVTAAADTNSVALATTAYVVGQAGSATPLVNGTAAVGTSLRYARQDHVHGTDTTRAPLDSPAFTGTPSLPTGTTAVTQTVGNNTTAVATTAFVQQEVPAASTTAAGKVELATVDEALRPSSPTLGMTPETTREMLMYPGYINLFGGGNVATSGTGAASTFTFATQRWHAMRSPNAAVAGYGMYIFDYSFSGIGMAAMTRGSSSHARKWNNRIWVSGRTVLGQFAEVTSGLNGDANCTARVMLGGRSSAGTGGMQAAEPGIGWRVAGGGSVAIVMTVSNGTTLTETTSSFTPVLGQVFDWKMYSDGTGNVTLWVNDSQVATSTGGPSTSTAENSNFYCEVVEQTASAATPLGIGNFGSKVFWSQA